MYYRNPDYGDVDRRVHAVHPVPEPAPLSLPDRLILSVGMLAVPAAAFLLTLGIAWLVGAL